MALVALVLVLSLALGRLLGGRVRRLGALEPAGWVLVLLAVAAQAGGAGIAAAVGSAAPYVAGSVLATLCALAFLARNRALHGIPLVAAGLLANAVVVAANGAMPVSLAAARRAGVGTGSIVAGLDPRHVAAGPGTALAALGDRIPFPLPGWPQVVSCGDVLVAAGLGLLLVTAMTSGARYDAGLAGRPHPQPQPRRRAQADSVGEAPNGIRATTRASASTTRGSYS